jgi:hypothetical protein
LAGLGKCLIGHQRIAAGLGSPQLIGNIFHILFSQRTHRVFPDNLDCCNRNDTDSILGFQVDSLRVDRGDGTGDPFARSQFQDYSIAAITLQLLVHIGSPFLADCRLSIISIICKHTFYVTHPVFKT